MARREHVGAKSLNTATQVGKIIVELAHPETARNVNPQE
jgi:hypothetical protein